MLLLKPQPYIGLFHWVQEDIGIYLLKNAGKYCYSA